MKKALVWITGIVLVLLNLFAIVNMALIFGGVFFIVPFLAFVFGIICAIGFLHYTVKYEYDWHSGWLLSALILTAVALVSSFARVNDSNTGFYVMKNDGQIAVQRATFAGFWNAGGAIERTDDIYLKTTARVIGKDGVIREWLVGGDTCHLNFSATREEVFEIMAKVATVEEWRDKVTQIFVDGTFAFVNEKFKDGNGPFPLSFEITLSKETVDQFKAWGYILSTDFSATRMRLIKPTL